MLGDGAGGHCDGPAAAAESTDVLEAGVGPWTKGRVDAVMEAAREQRWDVVAAALDAGGFPVDNKDDDIGWALLHWAACHGHVSTVARLLAVGADVNVRNGYDSTPAHVAASYDHVEALAAMVVGGADVNACDEVGFTPLFRARDSLLCTRYLLALPQVDVAAVSDRGSTAEKYAQTTGRVEVADAIRAEVRCVCRAAALCAARVSVHMHCRGEWGHLFCRREGAGLARVWGGGGGGGSVSLLGRTTR